MTGLGRRFQQSRQLIDLIRETSFDLFTSRLCSSKKTRALGQTADKHRDGTTHVYFNPLNVIARLAALVPIP